MIIWNHPYRNDIRFSVVLRYVSPYQKRVAKYIGSSNEGWAFPEVAYSPMAQVPDLAKIFSRNQHLAVAYAGRIWSLSIQGKRTQLFASVGIP